MFKITIYSAQLKSPVSYIVPQDKLNQEYEELKNGKIIWENAGDRGYYINPNSITLISFDKMKTEKSPIDEELEKKTQKKSLDELLEELEKKSSEIAPAPETKS